METLTLPPRERVIDLTQLPPIPRDAAVNRGLTLEPHQGLEGYVPGAESLATHELNSNSFRSLLAARGLVSSDLVGSGILERFERDDAPKSHGSDALMHILIGGDGGTHHVRTLFDLGIGNVEVASKLKYVEEKDKVRLAAKPIKQQTADGSGVYEAKHVKWVDQEGRRREKAQGSIMFPDEWSTEQVIRAIAATGEEPPVSVNEEEQVRTHVKEVDGVIVKVISDMVSGKIIAAHPVKG